MKITKSISAGLLSLSLIAAVTVGVSAADYKDYEITVDYLSYLSCYHGVFVERPMNTMYYDDQGGIHVIAEKLRLHNSSGAIDFTYFLFDVDESGKAVLRHRIQRYQDSESVSDTTPESSGKNQFYAEDGSSCTEEEFNAYFEPYDSMTKIDPDQGMYPKPENVETNELTIHVGEQIGLPVDLIPKKDSSLKVTWTCSDPTIAEISEDGTVKGLKTGIVTVTGTVDGIDGTICNCSVNVTSETNSSADS